MEKAAEQRLVAPHVAEEQLSLPHIDEWWTPTWCNTSIINTHSRLDLASVQVAVGRTMEDVKANEWIVGAAAT